MRSCCSLTQDDGSGRQQWTFVPVGSSYYIQVLQGRSGCGTYLSAQACGTGGAGANNPLFVTAPGNAGLEVCTPFYYNPGINGLTCTRSIHCILCYMNQNVGLPLLYT
jgi:hypothetical protein